MPNSWVRQVATSNAVTLLAGPVVFAGALEKTDLEFGFNKLTNMARVATTKALIPAGTWLDDEGIFNRPDTYMKATAESISAGHSLSEEVPTCIDGCRDATSAFIDESQFDGRQSVAYVGMMNIGITNNACKVH